MSYTNHHMVGNSFIYKTADDFDIGMDLRFRCTSIKNTVYSLTLILDKEECFGNRYDTNLIMQ